MKIKPLFSQILIKPIEHKSILLSDQRTLLEYGEVLDVGDDCRKVKVGDKIAFTIWGLNSIEIDGEKYYFVLESPDFLLGIVNESLE